MWWDSQVFHILSTILIQGTVFKKSLMFVMFISDNHMSCSGDELICGRIFLKNGYPDEVFVPLLFFYWISVFSITWCRSSVSGCQHCVGFRNWIKLKMMFFNFFISCHLLVVHCLLAVTFLRSLAEMSFPVTGHCACWPFWLQSHILQGKHFCLWFKITLFW